jgi:hypothetical protein
MRDLMWWSGLTAAEANAGLASVRAQLGRERIGAQDYYFAQDLLIAATTPPDAVLLPPFDEFLVGYRDRSAALDPHYNTQVVPGGNGVFNPIIVMGGRVVGAWKRVFKKESVVLTCNPFTAFTASQRRTIVAAAQHYASFVGKRALVDI